MFGVAIFTVLIMAGSFLYEFTRLLSQGVGISTILTLVWYLIPGILAKTFPMAMLLGTLLAFGRLSGESEIVALRAGGFSIIRIIVPVAIMGLAVSAVAYYLTDYVVPANTKRAIAMKDGVIKQIDKKGEQPTSRPIIDEDDNFVGYLVARDFNLAARRLRGVTILTYDKKGSVETIFEIESLQFTSLKEWKAEGKGILYSPKDFSRVTWNKGFWPAASARPTDTPDDLLAQDLKDLDGQSSTDLLQAIAKLKKDPNPDKPQIINLEFGYWNKFTVPLAAFVFGLVGAPLGIRNHRAGTATGFWLSVIIIFGYMLVTNVMNIMAQGGGIPPYLASFAPIITGLIVAVTLIWRKNAQ